MGFGRVTETEGGKRRNQRCIKESGKVKIKELIMEQDEWIDRGEVVGGMAEGMGWKD